MKTVLLCLAVGLHVGGVALAADDRGAPSCGDRQQDCCRRCGAKNVCKVVCEMKEVRKTCWVVQCEEFCVRLPRFFKSSCGDTGCGGECGGCQNDGCKSPGSRPMVPPKCGKVRYRKTLVKKEITCQVPVYRCVPVPTCGCANGGCVEPAGGVPVKAVR